MSVFFQKDHQIYSLILILAWFLFIYLFFKQSLLVSSFVFQIKCNPLFLLLSKTESNLSKEMELVIKDIKNTTQKKYMDYGKNPGSPDNDFLFMYSVAR